MNRIKNVSSSRISQFTNGTLPGDAQCSRKMKKRHRDNGRLSRMTATCSRVREKLTKITNPLTARASGSVGERRPVVSSSPGSPKSGPGNGCHTKIKRGRRRRHSRPSTGHSKFSARRGKRRSGRPAKGVRRTAAVCYHPRLGSATGRWRRGGRRACTRASRDTPPACARVCASVARVCASVARACAHGAGRFKLETAGAAALAPRRRRRRRDAKAVSVEHDDRRRPLLQHGHGPRDRDTYGLRVHGRRRPARFHGTGGGGPLFSPRLSRRARARACSTCGLRRAHTHTRVPPSSRTRTHASVSRR